MKKLGKLKLKEFAVMNDSEMKSIVGGYDPYDGGDENCKWFACICTESRSVMDPKERKHIIDAPNAMEAVKKLEKDYCKYYNRVTCTFDKNCGDSGY